VRKEPMFVRYANRQINAESVVKAYIQASNHQASLNIAQEMLEELPDLSIFRNDFSKALEDLIENGINRDFVEYVNCYMKPSLSEVLSGDGRNTTGEKRWVMIKDKDAPWIEALVCYNLTLYIKAFGHNELKKCPVCNKFFTNKGKYAKYCSDSCKGGK
jgi:hypothetical protein